MLLHRAATGFSLHVTAIRKYRWKREVLEKKMNILEEGLQYCKVASMCFVCAAFFHA